MPVSHARCTDLISADGDVPGLLEVLAQVRDPRKHRGRRYRLVAVAVVCALAGARSFRELGDQAADLPQEVLARLGGKPHPLRRKVLAPSETRLRTLIQNLDADALDELTGSWLRALAGAGQLEGMLRAVAIDGKWLRGVADGQVKLFAALLHEEKVVIAQRRIPDHTNETTQVNSCWTRSGWTARLSPRTPRMPRTTPRNTSPGSAARTTSCSSRAASPACSALSTTPFSNNARASRTTPS